MQKRRTQPFIILALLTIQIFAARAQTQGSQESGLSITSSVDRATCTIGDLLTYTVEVVHAESLRVEMPGLGANLGGFEIRDYRVHDAQKKDGLIYSKVDYVISTFLTGEFEIPSLRLRYFTPSDSAGKSLATETIKITVESVKPSEAGDIKDVKPPLEIPRNLWLLFRWIGLGILLAALAVLLLIIYIRRKAGKVLLPVREPPPRPPHEIALEALEELTASDLLDRGQIKQFYIDLSEIIRRYIGGRYFVVAMEMTTTEVLEGLIDTDLEEDLLHGFRSFLNRCDMVKFARFRPGRQEHDGMVRLAYDLVNRTSVILEAGPPAEDEAAGPDNKPAEESDTACIDAEKTEAEE